MASTALNTEINVTDSNKGKTGDWSVYNCVFCNSLLDGNSIILKCLHIACENCLTTKKIDSGVQCICLETTNGELKNYPIESPTISSIKTCSKNTCDYEANTICVICKSVFCKLCSKEHSCTKKERDFSVIHAYPLTKDFVLCPNCLKKCVYVYCIKCSIMICSLCHLSYHRNHNYEVLDTYGNIIRSNLSSQKLSLERNNSYLKQCLEETEKQVENLELKKILLYDKIDEEMEILHKEIEERSLELKSSVGSYVKKTISTVNENKNIFEDLQRKNSYYIALTESILNYGKTCDIVNLSKIVLDKTESAKVHSGNVSTIATEIKFDLDFDNKNANNCISSIKEMGRIVSSNMLSLLKVNNTNELSNKVFQLCENQVNVPVDHVEIKSEIESISSDESDKSSEYEPLVECSACNQWAEKLITCISCNRYYHNNCHIPLLPDTIDDQFLVNWKCTLCQDITKYSQKCIDLCVASDIPLNKPGKKIVERILLELFCQNHESEQFRQCPNKTDYPLYYEKVTNPISLNDIKARLECNNSYSNIFDVIKDIKLVFSNATTYYSQFDPFHVSACCLQISLNKMLDKWLPNMAL